MIALLKKKLIKTRFQIIKKQLEIRKIKDSFINIRKIFKVAILN